MLTLDTNLRRKKIYTAITIFSIFFIAIPWPFFVLGFDGIIPWFFSFLIFASLLGVRKRISNLENLSSADRILHLVGCLLVILYFFYALYVVNTGGFRTGLGIYGQWGSQTADEMNSMTWGIIALVTIYSVILFMPFFFVSKLNLKPSQ